MKNLYAPKKHFNFWKDLAWISVIVFVTVILGVNAKQNQIVVNAAELIYITPTPIQYKEPELANLPEREANIALIRKIWGSDANVGLNLARCESGYRTLAKNINTNGTVDQGVFQINSIHNMPEMDIATANISYAYTKYLKQGTNPWKSSSSCWGEKI